MSRFMTSDITKWMEMLLLKVHMGMLEWKLNAFMEDDVVVEIGAIRYIDMSVVFLHFSECNVIYIIVDSLYKDIYLTLYDIYV